MISPAAHTSKGLAKAFVSSAGGKGPDSFFNSPGPSISYDTQRIAGPPG